MQKLSGFALALAGFALLTCGDAVIKTMAGQWPPSAVAALRFSVAVPMLLALILATQGKAALRIQRPWVQFARGLSLACSTLLFFSSLFLLPLAVAAAIVFASPIITAFLSALFLKEPLQRGAWLASLIALIGVALVLRPNFAEAGMAAFLPLGAAFFFALMLIFNRMAVGTGSPMALQLVLVAVAAPIMLLIAYGGDASGFAPLQVSWPDPSVVLRCCIVAVSASIAHWLIYMGTTRGTAADVAQAVYVQLPVALVIDIAMFGNFPDLMALSGAVLIVGAGLTLLMAQRGVVQN